MTTSRLQARVANARALAKATKAWTADAAAAATGTQWRPTSSWIQQADGTRWVELTNVCNGKTLIIRLGQDEGVELLRARLVDGE